MTVAEDALLHISHQQREGNRRIAKRPDVLDLYETVAVSASTITASADSIFAAHLMHGEPTRNVINDARAAAERVLRALKEYEDQIETMEMGS